VSSTYTERINFIQKSLGKGQVSRDGNDISISCPHCKEHLKKKLAINLENWKFHCWVCDAKGNSLVPLLRKFSSNENLAYYRAHFLNDKIFAADLEFVEEQAVKLPDGFLPIVLANLKHPDVKAAMRYLCARNITEHEMWKFKIGITVSDEKFARRIIFPSLNADYEENYFVGRSIDKNARIRYMNAINDKTSIIFNDYAIDWDKKIYLTEGIFDFIALKENGTCMLGSSLSESSLLFKKLVANESDIVLCLDNDMVKKTARTADLLTSYGCKVEVMDTSSAKDIAEMTNEQLDIAKETIKEWSPKTSFLYKISTIKSGSMF